MATWREEERAGRRRDRNENKRGESLREREREEGPNSPFYRGLSYLAVVG